ncbi:hypothetical protein [Hydrogenoanaerobacterium sp.]|uniref:hypothetical protein n=1 Tax=Hydrogenoanaerobacterium sp. TaxID=2953763 RepID=UPI00289CE610|nr:hypothetical protein [Hydrogenoanaerobacterium sp.]
MLVRYKRNKRYACYDTESLVPRGRPEIPPRPHGPFASCGACPYASHGFVCYGKEGECLRTDMNRLDRRRENRYAEIDAPQK